MSRFTLLVTTAPYDDQGPSTALRFAQSVIKSDHQLAGVFFYAQGVGTANQLLLPPSDESNLHQQWSEFSRQHNVPLQVCVTAGNRRGVVSHTEAQEAGLEQYNLALPFDQVGLGELMQLLADSDRVVQF
ncbi:sulfurtransferase complex subunit TusD [Aestuariibacter halophilus]|uniref:Sulfurtransferase complex subunit TusD n=1 Tax=Fluctibacter halophilus TaxID=226011 RepID=A0ABS8G7F7_9ALTE|nr:sulfurtransferase complex subunit TusD [Aestuariibacter halophilus]MCC2615750.1 sulfurtransferase complex subunit TusD [Aestuariibacter halophilus]